MNTEEQAKVLRMLRWIARYFRLNESPLAAKDLGNVITELKRLWALEDEAKNKVT